MSSVTELRIINWHQKTFTDVKEADYQNKLVEELEEAREVILNSVFSHEIDIDHLAEEIADVVIVATAYLKRQYNISLNDKVKRKLDKNMSRKFKPDGTREK